MSVSQGRKVAPCFELLQALKISLDGPRKGTTMRPHFDPNFGFKFEKRTLGLPIMNTRNGRKTRRKEKGVPKGMFVPMI